MIRLRLRWKIAAWCSLLVVALQGIGLILFAQIGRSSAIADARMEVATAQRVFDRQIAHRAAQLSQAARVLAADYGFREALLSQDRDTIVSALDNHGGRIGADLALLLALDESVVAGSIGLPQGLPARVHQLIEAVRNRQEGSGFAVIADRLHQIVVVPVLAPVPTAWVVLGFQVEQGLVDDLRGLTGLQLSFVRRGARDDWFLDASSLPPDVGQALLARFRNASLGGEDTVAVAVADDDYVTHVHALDIGEPGEAAVVLMLSLDRALAPWERLFRESAALSAAGIVIALLASAVLGGTIAAPVMRLAGFAQRVQRGEYGGPPELSRGDEIGELADAFSAMTGEIANREARISELAYYDGLTGLPNRAWFGERLADAVGDALRSEGTVAVITLDLDRFRMVNDALGHGVGDLLLQKVGRRLRETMRDARDQVARLGGDEFAVMLPGADLHRAQAVAQRVAEVLQAPMNLSGQVVDIDASMGISACPEHGEEAAQLMRHAEIAMYQAKRGNARFKIYDPADHDRNVQRLSLLTELRHAVENDELVLYYQPKVATRPDPAHHVEALVRWIHPSRGFIPPFDFIPFAEQTGYIKYITLWVMNAAVRQCGQWLQQGLEVNVSLNISARDLLNPELPVLFDGMLQRHDCPARLITLEITESAVLDDPDHALANLQALRATGCALSIDDYGTGYSSLSYLRRMPVSEMKIDRSFVMHLLDNPNDEIIVRSTIELAHNMGLKVTAEGVESEDVLNRLRELGCDLVQGYLISKPIPREQLERWFAESHWAAAWPDAGRRTGMAGG
ncbi:putative bifunctional diguanylate cyclase/phosphodiesterase [Methyloversatilis thermotolerans]|uniref:putative bifunctional diguanylate cyclase/phosphodiesterase n=1 Tax=Methyloversatilis thermotolerans TaxID=1346290 RepID=UPI000376062C|nr:EAL domain-containing protein [Methyloversatilis thermotolerans]